MKNNVIFCLLVSVFCAQVYPVKSYDLPPEMKAGTKFVQGVLDFCTNMHKSSMGELIKTFQFDENNHNAKCSMMCILQSVQVMQSNGEIATTAIDNVLEKLPDNDKKTMLQNTLHQCTSTAQKTSDGCERAFLFIKCISKVKDEIPMDTVIKSAVSLFMQ